MQQDLLAEVRVEFPFVMRLAKTKLWAIITRIRTVVKMESMKTVRLARPFFGFRAKSLTSNIDSESKESLDEEMGIYPFPVWILSIERWCT